MIAATIATYAAFLGFVSETYEPIAWAEELIEPARAVDHPRLGTLYVLASLCWMPGRVDESVRYSDVGQLVIGSRPSVVPFGVDGWLGSVYMVTGQPERWAEWCRTQLAQDRDTHTITRASLIFALTTARFADEATAAANGLIEAAEKLHNPYALSFALSAYGYAFSDADPVRALGAMRRGLVIARDNGNRFNESFLAQNVARVEVAHGDPLAALDFMALAIRRHHDVGQHWPHVRPAGCPRCTSRTARTLRTSGNHRRVRSISPLTAVALSGYKQCDRARFPKSSAIRPMNRSPAQGETMTTAEMVTYAYDQIDQARAELNAVSK